MGSETMVSHHLHGRWALPSPSGLSSHIMSTKRPHPSQPEAAPSSSCCLSHTLFLYCTCHYLKLPALLFDYLFIISLTLYPQKTLRMPQLRDPLWPCTCCTRCPVHKRCSMRVHWRNECHHTLTSFRVLCSAAWILWSISSSISLNCIAALSWALKFKRMHMFSLYSWTCNIKEKLQTTLFQALYFTNEEKYTI